MGWGDLGERVDNTKSSEIFRPIICNQQQVPLRPFFSFKADMHHTNSIAYAY